MCSQSEAQVGTRRGLVRSTTSGLEVVVFAITSACAGWSAFIGIGIITTDLPPVHRPTCYVAKTESNIAHIPTDSRLIVVRRFQVNIKTIVIGK